MTPEDKAELEAMVRRVVRSELEARARRRVRPSDVPAEPTIVVDDVTRQRVRHELAKRGLGRSKVGGR